MTDHATDHDETVTYPGARRPDRVRRVDSHGVGINVIEWGNESDPPVMLLHGGFDFAETFNGFAPLLADAGWRVVAWDHRGHGDSDHVEFYSWDADVRDALAVIRSTSRDPVPVIGHSKGGGVLTQIIEAQPHRVTRFVNIDGLPAHRPRPDVADHERTRLLHTDISRWLEHRRAAATLVRKPGTLDELARRRARMNPRLSIEWLRYLVSVGARRDPDGWRWKIDPALRFGGFGPWRGDWNIQRFPGLSVPVLGILGVQPEEMGWGTRPEDVAPYMPPRSRVVGFDDSGHFVHIEKRQEVTDLVLEFLDPVR